MSFSSLRTPGAAFLFVLPGLATVLPAPATAQSPPEAPPGSGTSAVAEAAAVALDPVVVTGHATPPLPAPIAVQTADEIASAPATDALDLFRRTPGAITVNFGQGDIGNPIGLRGFASAHGQDVAIFVDGVPINVPNHAHAHGLADIGWLLPEMIERIEVIKGPFSAQYGNFALGGAINIVTKSADDTSLSAAGGSYGHERALGIYGTPVGGVTPFLLGEVDHDRGFRDNAHYNRYNLFDKASTDVLGGTASLRVQAVARDFGAAGFLPAAGVRDGTYARTTAVDTTDGGNSKLYDAVFNFVPGRLGGPRLTAYAGHDRLDRYADFGLPGPPALSTNQYQDHTERSFYGWRGSYDVALGRAGALVLGTDGQYDDGVYQRFTTVGREIQPQATQRDRAARQLGAGVWTQATLRAGERVVVLGGLRYDHFSIRVDNRLAPDLSGRATPHALSPKFGVVVTPVKGVEAFANVARGFRSPAAQELSPDGGTRFVALQSPTLVSGDVGLKLKPAPGLALTLDYYLTRTHDEITEQATDFVNVGATRRQGFELAASYDVTPDLNLFASYAGVRARLDSGQARGQDYLANVPGDSQTLGLTWTARPRGRVGLRVVFDNYLQRLGVQPLNADRSATGPAVLRYATKVSVLTRTPWSGAVQLTYVPNRYAGESVFDFGNPGMPDVRYAPNPVLSALASVRYAFR